MKLAVVGVGSAGSRIVNRVLEYERLSGRNLTNGNTLLINANEPDFDTTEHVPEDRRLLIGDVPWEVDATGIDADPDLAASVAREERHDLNRAYDLIEFHQVDGILVVAGLAGGTGGGAGAVVIDQLQCICDVPVYAVGVLPSETEGQKSALNAARALQSFVDVADNVIGFDNDWWCSEERLERSKTDDLDGTSSTGVSLDADEAPADDDSDGIDGVDDDRDGPDVADGGFDWETEPQDERHSAEGSDVDDDAVDDDADSDEAGSADDPPESQTVDDGDSPGVETVEADEPADVSTPDAAEFAHVNAALAERIVTLFAAGEFRGAEGSEYRLDPSDIIRTLDTGGISTIGYASIDVARPGGVRSWVRSLQARFPWTSAPDSDAEQGTDAAKINGLVRRAARSDLTLPCEISSADRALISFSGPSRELSRKGFESGRYWLEGEADVVDVMAGDAPHERSDTLVAVVLFSNVTDVPRIGSMQETAVGDQHPPSAEGRTYGTANPS